MTDHTERVLRNLKTWRDNGDGIFRWTLSRAIEMIESRASAESDKQEAVYLEYVGEDDDRDVWVFIEKERFEHLKKWKSPEIYKQLYTAPLTHSAKSDKQEAVYPTLKGHQAMWDEWHPAESDKQEAVAYWTKEQVQAVREDAKRLHAKLNSPTLLPDPSDKQEADVIEHNSQNIMQIWFECNRDVFTFYDWIVAHPIASADVRDAERYRWLRDKTRGWRIPLHGGTGTSPQVDGFQFPLPEPVGNIMQGSVAQHLDDAIDAAIAANRASEETKDKKCTCGVCLECNWARSHE